MATAKAPKKSAPAKGEKPAKPTGQLNTINARLAELAKKNAKQEASTATGFQFISFKGGNMTIDGASVEDDTMDVVILVSKIEHHYYTRKYDPDNPSSPACYAFGEDADEMAPHDKCESPQSDLCANCPHNEWGSAERGNGKACANVRRLAVLAADQLDDVANAEVRGMKIPVTSVKNYAKYIRDLEKVKSLPPLAVVTRVSLVKNEDTVFKVLFKHVEDIEDPETLDALMKRAESVEDDLTQPYPENGPEPEPRRNRSAIAGKAKQVVKGKPAPKSARR